MIETEVRPITPETVTPLRPSEAMRLGRLLRPKRIKGQMFRGDHGACALGAIQVGAGLAPTERHEWEAFPSLMGMTSCPLGVIGTPGRCYLGRNKSTVSFFVTHLNDSHGWRDARIIGWLESLGL